MLKWFAGYRKLYLVSARKRDATSPVYDIYDVFEARFRKDRFVGRTRSLRKSYELIFADRGKGAVRIDINYE